MKGIVLAGGTGSRLYPLTKVTNKHLLPVYDEPMIFKPIKTLRDSGIKDIIVVLGGESIGEVVRVLGNGRELGVNLAYVYQEESAGIADALHTTKRLVQGEKLAVILGDNVFTQKFDEEAREFEKQREYNCYLFLNEVDEPSHYGIADIDEKGNILSIDEKPESSKSNLAVTGLYFYDNTVFSAIEQLREKKVFSKNNEFEISAVNQRLLEKNRVKSQLLKSYWSDAGTIDNLMKTSWYLAKL